MSRKKQASLFSAPAKPAPESLTVAECIDDKGAMAGGIRDIIRICGKSPILF